MVLKNSQQLVMIGYTLHPSILGAEADESLSVLSQSGFHRESQISQRLHSEILFQEKQNNSSDGVTDVCNSQTCEAKARIFCQ